MEIVINNFDDLLTFIKRDNVTVEQALKVVTKGLNVIVIFPLTKEELITETENFIDKWCIDNEGERPLFLGQEEIDFKIEQIWKNR
jgi:hypothetical protein